MALGKCIALDRRSVRKNQRHAAIKQSSGWSNRKSHLTIWTMIWIWRKIFWVHCPKCFEGLRRGLKVLERDITKLQNVKKPLPRITYDEAVKILHDKGLPFEWGNDLGGNRWDGCSEQFDRPVMVHRYPSEWRHSIWNAIRRIQSLRLLLMYWLRKIWWNHRRSQREDDSGCFTGTIKEHKLPQQHLNGILICAASEVYLMLDLSWCWTNGWLDLRNRTVREHLLPANDLSQYSVIFCGYFRTWKVQY